MSVSIPHIKKVISTSSLKSCQLWSPLLYQVDIDAPTKKPQWISMRTPKTCIFRPLNKNQINADPPHWSEVIFDKPHNNEIRFILHWNQVKFDPPHCNQGDLDHHTKCKSSCMLTLKASDFHPGFKNQVNFHHPHNTQINFIPTLKSSQIRSPTLKSSQNGPLTQITSQF